MSQDLNKKSMKYLQISDFSLKEMYSKLYSSVLKLSMELFSTKLAVIRLKRQFIKCVADDLKNYDYF